MTTCSLQFQGHLVQDKTINTNTGRPTTSCCEVQQQDNQLFEDWSAHMENATNDIDYLQKAGKLSIAAGASYTTPQEDSTVSATRSSVKSETVNASWQAITAGRSRRPLTKPAPRSTTSATRKSSRSTSRTPRT